MIKYIATSLLLLSTASCSDGSTKLRIENQSSETLNALQASGSGFAAYVGTLRPGEHRQLKIYPRGESGLGLSFTVRGHSHSSPDSGYFEGGGGYRVKAVVAPNLSVKVEESGL